MVKCLRQGGRGGGGGGQARRVRMVRRLLQRLDQVVSVLRVYGPQRAFAYALKDTREMRGMLLEVLSGPLKGTTQTERSAQV